LLRGLKPWPPRRERLWGASASGGEPLATWGAAAGAWRVERITRVPYGQECVVRPWCGMVEGTSGGMGRPRRWSKGDERTVQTRATRLQRTMRRRRVSRWARRLGCFFKHALR
jgi:hypothetical protein